MQNEAAIQAQAELTPGERLLWSGRPGPGALARARLTGAYNGAMLAIGGAMWVFMTHPAFMPPGAESGLGAIVWLIGLPLLLPGLALILYVPFAFVQAPSMVYGVTDRRAFIVGGMPLRRVSSFGPGDLTGMFVRPNPDGSGDLVLRRDRNIIGRARGRHHGPGFSHRPTASPTYTERGFFGIARVREVEALVAKLAERR